MEKIERILKIDIVAEFMKIVDSLAGEIIEEQTKQLYAGKRADGSKIAPPYALSTIKRKKRKGQPTGRVTLSDTGKYYSRFKVLTGQNKVQLTAFYEVARGFDLANFLRNKYGKEIEGLSEAAEKRLIKQIEIRMMRLWK